MVFLNYLINKKLNIGNRMKSSQYELNMLGCLRVTKVITI